MSEETVEQKAADIGWVPLDQWKGDPDKWRPAEEFVERGEKILPILKKELDKTKAELKIALSLNQQEIERIKADAYEKAKAEYQAKIRIIDQREVEAFKNQDVELLGEVRKARESVKPPEPPKPIAPQKDVVFEDWASKNAWYQTDKELADAADIISHKIVAERGGKVTEADRPALLEEMTKRVKSAHPTKFSNPKREEPGGVEGGSQQAAPKKSGKTFDSLPESAKGAYNKLADKFKAKGRTFTKEQYAQAYYEQQ
jgi:hypothetical protein